MKIQIKNYTFNKTNKTITFNDYTSIDLDGILLITNVTDNVIIYNFAALGGTVSGNILTLNYDTTDMSDDDDLQIFYDDPNADPVVLLTTLNSLTETLQELTSRLSTLASMANSGSPGVGLRVIPLTSPNMNVVSTVSTVTNLTNFGTGVPAKEVADDMNNLLVTLANINNVTS